MIGIMRLEVLRWYDWLFIFFAALWLPAIVDMLFQSGFVMAIYLLAVWPVFCLVIAIAYFPVYIACKVYKWKKRRGVM